MYGTRAFRNGSLRRSGPVAAPRRRRAKAHSFHLSTRSAREASDGGGGGGDAAAAVSRTVSGTMKTDVGNSAFYSKYGIMPIQDSTTSLQMDNRERTASVKIKKMTKLHDGGSKFPKLGECAHFHYDFTELGPVQVCMTDDNQENVHRSDADSDEPIFYLKVLSNRKAWPIRRTYEDLRLLDKQLHRCIFDRKFSQLPELRRNELRDDNMLAMRKLLALYLSRFSSISGNMINCGTILNWLEMDNRGNHLIAVDDSAINTPAIGAGHVIKRYAAQAADELSFEVGDIVSIIDMPRAEETVWWRGKKGFEVGFFPSECVELIGDRDKIPPSVTSAIPETPQKPVLRRRGKLISFLRMFFLNRPARATLKTKGIVKERLFGCDLGEHLLNSGLDVPLILKYCADVIESHGIVDGIYRLSGVASNIQKLRLEFDQDEVPDLTSEIYLQDIHSISSLLKMYFRELPNPLLTYQLYDKFQTAVSEDEDIRLARVRDVVQQLPPPHYRTAETLIRHLARVATHGAKTGMHCKNLAIVWAPNLLRSKDLESSCDAAALQGVGLQAVVTEYLITYAELIFSDKLPHYNGENLLSASPRRVRPKSLAISTPTKLLSLEEARERALSTSAAHPANQKYLEVGGGPGNLPPVYHTVIDLPYKKKMSRKDHKAVVGAGGWRSLFSRGRTHSLKGAGYKPPPGTFHQYQQVSSLRMPSKGDRVLTEDDVARRRKLRSVKSADSLLSSSASMREVRTSQHAANAGGDLRTSMESGTDTVRSDTTSNRRTSGSKRTLSVDHYTGGYHSAESDMDLSPTEDDGVFLSGAFDHLDTRSMEGAIGASSDSYLTYETADIVHGRGARPLAEGYVYHSHDALQQPQHAMRQHSQDSLHSEGAAAMLYGLEGATSLDTKLTPPPEIYGLNKVLRSRSVEQQVESEDAALNMQLEAQAPPLMPRSRAGWSPSEPYIPPLPNQPMSTFKGSSQSAESPPTSPVKSPSIKDRIIEAFSPKARRKKMRAPSPPKSPTPEQQKLMSPSDSSSPSWPTPPQLSPLKSPMSMLPSMSEFGGTGGTAIMNRHFLDKEHSPGVEDENENYPTSGSNTLTESSRGSSSREITPETDSTSSMESFMGGGAARYVATASVLSPIGEMSPASDSSSPRAGRQDRRMYSSLETQGEEGAACSLASVTSLSDADAAFHGQRVHVTTDSSDASIDTAGRFGGREIQPGVVSNVLVESAGQTHAPPPQHHAATQPPHAATRSATAPVPPPRREKSLDSEMTVSEPNLASPGDATDGRTATTPGALQKSTDTLNSNTDPGSIGSFSELSKSLDSLLNDVGSHRDSTYTTSSSNRDSVYTANSHGDDAAAAAHSGGRDRRSVHALGLTDSEAALESLGDSTTLLATRVGYSSTSSIDSDLHPAQVYAQTLYSPPPSSASASTVVSLHSSGGDARSPRSPLSPTSPPPAAASSDSFPSPPSDALHSDATTPSAADAPKPVPTNTGYLETNIDSPEYKQTAYLASQETLDSHSMDAVSLEEPGQSEADTEIVLLEEEVQYVDIRPIEPERPLDLPIRKQEMAMSPPASPADADLVELNTVLLSPAATREKVSSPEVDLDSTLLRGADSVVSGEHTHIQSKEISPVSPQARDEQGSHLDNAKVDLSPPRRSHDAQNLTNDSTAVLSPSSPSEERSHEFLAKSREIDITSPDGNQAKHSGTRSPEVSSSPMDVDSLSSSYDKTVDNFPTNEDKVAVMTPDNISMEDELSDLDKDQKVGQVERSRPSKFSTDSMPSSGDELGHGKMDISFHSDKDVLEEDAFFMETTSKSKSSSVDSLDKGPGAPKSPKLEEEEKLIRARLSAASREVTKSSERLKSPEEEKTNLLTPSVSPNSTASSSTGILSPKSGEVQTEAVREKQDSGESKDAAAADSSFVMRAAAVATVVEDTKAAPVPKRKRSVKDLLCQFETLTHSPPKEQMAEPSPPQGTGGQSPPVNSTAQPQTPPIMVAEPTSADGVVKARPAVFQKPKIVHLKTLSTGTVQSAGDFSQAPQQSFQNKAPSKPAREPSAKSRETAAQPGAAPPVAAPRASKEKAPAPPVAKPRDINRPVPEERTTVTNGQSLMSKSLDQSMLLKALDSSHTSELTIDTSYDADLMSRSVELTASELSKDRPVKPAKKLGHSPSFKERLRVYEAQREGKPQAAPGGPTETLGLNTANRNDRASSEESVGSVRNLSKMFERQNSNRSDGFSDRSRSVSREPEEQMKPPTAAVTSSAASEVKPKMDGTKDGQSDKKEQIPAQSEHEQNNGAADVSPTKQKKSVRKLMGMFEQQEPEESASRSASGDERGPRPPGGRKPWTAIV